MADQKYTLQEIKPLFLVDNLSDTLKQLGDACRKRFGKTERLTLQDMVKLIMPPAQATIVPVKTLILHASNYNSAKYAVDHDTKILGSEMKNISQAISIINAGDAKIVMHLCVNGGTNGKAVPVYTTLFNHSQFKGNDINVASNKIGINYIVTIPVTKGSLTTADDFTINLHPENGWIQLDPATTYIEVVAVGGVIRTALSAFRQHFKSHFFEKRGVD